MRAPPESMILHFLGAGGAFSRSYGTTCSVLELDDARWLIDCGRQAPDQLAAAGISWHDIEGQIITHVHGDHVFGLEDFAFMRFYESTKEVQAVHLGGPKPQLLAHEAVMAELWECMAPSLRYLREGENLRAGTMAHYFELCAANESQAARANPWLHAQRFALGESGVGLVARESEHVLGKPSCSLEIEVGAASDGAPAPIAWWSGDCTVDAAHLSALEPRCSVFFHDCTFVEYPGQVHGAFSLIEQLPRAVLDKLVIMHHEDNIEANRARVEALGVRVALPGQRWDLKTGLQLD